MHPQDIRVIEEKLRNESLLKREVQQRLDYFWQEVDQERQLLFEALAYLNDDIHSSSPNLEKMQSDLQRLRDYIAYKVDHSEEEKGHFKMKSLSESSQLTTVDLSASSSSEKSRINAYDSSTYQLLLGNGDGVNAVCTSDCTSMAIRVLESEEEVELLKVETYNLNLKLQELTYLQEKSRIEKEIETANLVEILVVEKESLSGERDLLLQLLSEAATDAVFYQNAISLNEIAAREDSSRYAVSDLERAKYLIKDKELTEQYEHAAEQIFHLTSELDKVNEESVDNLKANKELNDKNFALEAAIQVEKESREKERISLLSALNGMDTLTAQVAERDAALVRVKDLESEIGRISKEREREIEKGSNYEDKCDSLQDEIILMREELKGIKVKDKEQTSLISGLQEKLVKAEEEQKHHIDMRDMIDHLQNELEEADGRGEEMRDMITQLQEEKDEYENDAEVIHLAEKASELRSQLSTTVLNAELAAIVSWETIADRQNEIDRLVLDFDKTVKELNDSKLQLSTAALNAKVAELASTVMIAGSQKEIDRLSVDLNKVTKSFDDFKTLTEITGTELFVALQSNKELIEETATLRMKIEQLEEEVAAKGSSSLLSITTTENISEAIQASKISLALATAQVDTMRSQLLEMTELKEESESKLKVSESLVATLNEALRDAPPNKTYPNRAGGCTVEGLSPSPFLSCSLSTKVAEVAYIETIAGSQKEIDAPLNIKSGLNLPLERPLATVSASSHTEIIEGLPSVPSPSPDLTKYEKKICDSESQAASLSIDLEYMTQLRDMAETRAAAIALVGSGNRVLEAVQQLSLSTQPSARASAPLTPRSENITSVNGNTSLTPEPVLSEQNIERVRQGGYINSKNIDETNNLYEDMNIFAFTSVDMVDDALASDKNPFGVQDIDSDVGVTGDDDNGGSKNTNSIVTGRMIDSSHYDKDNVSMSIHGGDEDDNDKRSDFEMNRNSHNHHNCNLSINEKHHVKYQDVIHQLLSSPKRSYGDEGIIFPPQSPLRHVPDIPQPGIRGLVQDNQGHGRVPVPGGGQSNSKPHRGSSERLGSVRSQSPKRHNSNNYRSTSRVP
mmetsp:Transcript_35270/g.33497  ORF Transcript_35270/g.33497 Transcript_35270/m.33497 type:complete len:1083 (+) Transcript_35270:92-3340(+)